MDIGRELPARTVERPWSGPAAQPDTSAARTGDTITTRHVAYGLDEWAPDIVEPVIAWRVWRVDLDGAAARLGSVCGSNVWPVGRALVGACRSLPGQHPAPWRNCLCGVRGARTADHAVDAASQPGRADQYVAFGLVAMWGRIVETDRGWRASHAYPQRVGVLAPALATTIQQKRVAFDLADYGAPVEIVTGARAASTDHLLRWMAEPEERRQSDRELRSRLLVTCRVTATNEGGLTVLRTPVSV